MVRASAPGAGCWIRQASPAQGATFRPPLYASMDQAFENWSGSGLLRPGSKHQTHKGDDYAGKTWDNARYGRQRKKRNVQRKRVRETQHAENKAPRAAI